MLQPEPPASPCHLAGRGVRRDGGITNHPVENNCNLQYFSFSSRRSGWHALPLIHPFKQPPPAIAFSSLAACRDNSTNLILLFFSLLTNIISKLQPWKRFRHP